jgi:hypothetical protein
MKCLKQGLECSYKTTTKSGPTETSKSSKGTSKPESETLPSTDKEIEKPEQSTDDDLSITVQDTATHTTTTSPKSTPSLLDHGDPTFPEGLSFADLLENELTFDFWSLSNDGGSKCS